MHACMHACIHAYMHTCMHACMHAFIHTYMHTCMHACIQMYIYIPSPSALLQIEEFRKALEAILDESIVHQGLKAKTHETDAEDTKRNKKDDTSGPDDVIPAEKPKQFRLCKIKDRFRTCVGPMDICVLHCTSPLSVAIRASIISSTLELLQPVRHAIAASLCRARQRMCGSCIRL